MSDCPDCGRPAGLLAFTRGGFCSECADNTNPRESRAIREYSSAVDVVASGNSDPAQAARLRELEAEIADEQVIAEHKDRAWVQIMERVLASNELGPSETSELDRFEELLPQPEGFDERHPEQVGRLMVAFIESDLPLPVVEDSTLTLGKGNAVHLEVEADLMENVPDFQRTETGHRQRRVWAAGDSGVLSVTRFGVVFLGKIAHRDFGFDQIIQVEPYPDAVHFHVHGYSDGMRFKIPMEGQVVVSMIKRLKRESNENLRELAGRTFRTWRRWKREPGKRH